MAKVKIFLPTYKRNSLLKRSVQSILNQTFQDWECEVHNDDPTDDFPEKYISSLNDTRFIFNQHQINLGPIATFNLMFEPTLAKYICLLEDDNWWEPEFLAKMTECMDASPDIVVAFSNANIWQELPENRWEKLQQTTCDEPEPAKYFYFPSINHIFHYHQSNCSTMIRNYPKIGDLKVPVNIRFDFIEGIRERASPHPLLFINETLSNFSQTLATTRKISLDGIFENYLLLIDSFFTKVKIDENYIKLLWAGARQNTIKSFNKLLYTGLICKNSRKLLQEATWSEWIFFFMYNVKHPLIFFKCLRAKRKYHVLWQYLLLNTQKRIDESEIKQLV